MGDKSKIEWTDATWNPVTGCSKVSQGCKFCYAERQFPRVYGDRKFTDVQCHVNRLEQPLLWRRSRIVFVNSMSDLFHPDVPDEFIDKVFAMMALAKQHTFQVLTKRPERMARYVDTEFRSNLIMDQMMALTPDRGVWSWPGWREAFAHLWLGVSVEDQETANERIPLLLQTPASVRWVSAEPLLGPVRLGKWLEYCPSSKNEDGVSHALLFDGDDPYTVCAWCHERRDALRGHVIGEKHSVRGIDWIVVGGESGPKARPMHPDWARSIRDQCKAAKVPYFFKQWGEWAPAHPWHEQAEGTWLHFGGKTFGPTEGNPFSPVTTAAHMIRYGKKRAGSFLDGIEHKEYPEVQP